MTKIKMDPRSKLPRGSHRDPPPTVLRPTLTQLQNYHQYRRGLPSPPQTAIRPPQHFVAPQDTLYRPGQASLPQSDFVAAQPIATAQSQAAPQTALQVSESLVAPRHILKPKAPSAKRTSQPSAISTSTCPLLHSTDRMDKRHPSSFQQLEKVPD